MPYTPAALAIVATRVGWAQALQPTTITVSSPAIESGSGRYFRDFHAMVTAENVSATLSTSTSQAVSNETLNAHLVSMKTAAAGKVLDAVFNLNTRAQRRRNYNGSYTNTSGTLWDTVIMARLDLFDTVMGLQGAADALELQLVSSRSNGLERSAKVAGQLQVDLHGYYDPNSQKKVIPGLYAELKKAIADVIDILFPEPATGPYLMNASHKW